MSIPTDYQGIIDEVAAWLIRDDLKDRIPTWIYYTEKQLNRVLRHLRMEVRKKAICVPGQDYIKLPDDYLEKRNFQINADGRTYPLDIQSPRNMDSMSYLPAGMPRFYSVVGLRLLLTPIPNKAYQLEMHYYQKIPHLSVAKPTNFLTDEAPDLLVFGALMHAEPHLKNDDRMAMWASSFQANLTAMNEAHRRARYSGSPLQMKSIR